MFFMTSVKNSPEFPQNSTENVTNPILQFTVKTSKSCKIFLDLISGKGIKLGTGSASCTSQTPFEVSLPKETEHIWIVINDGKKILLNESWTLPLKIYKSIQIKDKIASIQETPREPISAWNIPIVDIPIILI